jgi:hypothetical protein
MYNHTGLIDGQEYEYRLKAIDFRSQESGFSEIAIGIPMDIVAPEPPKGLTIVEITNNSIELTWEPNTEPDLEGYNVYRYTLAKPDDWGDVIGSVEAGNESYLDPSLEEATTYYYVITTFDEVPNESNYSRVVTGTTLLGPHAPEINNTIDDFEMNEDSVDSTTINLYHWFKDINRDPLIFSCEGQKNISVKIFQNNGTVIFTPAKDWSGVETITFFAFDGIFNITDDVKITVLPVNDPPGPAVIKEPENGLEVYENTKLNFTGTCSDPDLLYVDELTFNWHSDLQGVLGTGDTLIDVDLDVGTHQITLNVSDKAGSYSIANINIVILELPTEPEIEDKEKSDHLMDLYLPVLVIVIILIILLLIFIQKSRYARSKSSEAEGAASRFSFLSLRVSGPQTQGAEPGTNLDEDEREDEFEEE